MSLRLRRSPPWHLVAVLACIVTVVMFDNSSKLRNVEDTMTIAETGNNNVNLNVSLHVHLTIDDSNRAYERALQRSLASGGLIPINTSKKGWRESYERGLDVLRGGKQRRRTPWELVKEDPVLYHRDESRMNHRNHRQQQHHRSTKRSDGNNNNNNNNEGFLAALPSIRHATAVSLPNVACVYTGFIRDFARMVDDCRVGCHKPKYRRLWGRHRSRLWRLSRCDIFMTTWHMHGVGGYRHL
eukprot:PhM_4_TR830/c0_g2_i1/m.59578